MVEPIHESEYTALAELRYRIRQFLRGSDDRARAAGLEPQQYQLLLAVRAFRDRSQASIRRLAERLQLKHHSVVGLVDRLEAHGYARRTRSAGDQRQVVVSLLPRGRKALELVVGQRLHELRETGHALVSALTAILEDSRAGQQSPKSSRIRARRKRAKRRRRTDARTP